MRKDKHLATQLRRQGKSYQYIEKNLRISRSTLSAWFSGFQWSRDVKADLSKQAQSAAIKRLRHSLLVRKTVWAQQRKEARKEAQDSFLRLARNPLFIAGIMLYWGEGDNKSESSLMGLTNTNSHMMRIFTRFLLEICKLPKDRLRAQMILYPDLDERECKKFWSRSTDIPIEQFYKTQFIKGRHPTKRLSHGIFMIRFRNFYLKEKILLWIDLFQKQFPS